MKKLPGVLALVLGLAAAAPAAQAQDNYPTRPIRLIVPFNPGGGTDIVARLIAPYLSERLGQQVVVENRSGAGGAVGSAMVAKAPPDGYTILFADSARTIAPYMTKDLTFDFAKDFQPLGLIALTPLLLLANPQAPVKTLPELVAYAKAHPGQLTYGSSGTGTPQHFAVELLKGATGIDLTHVPYKGAAAVITDTVGGQVNLASATYPPSTEFIRDGRLRPLATMEPKRLSYLPDVPSASEFYPDVVMSIWFGLVAPAATDPAVVKKLEAAITATVDDPGYSAKLRAAGFDTTTENADQFRARIQRELKVFGDIARKAGIKPE